MRADRLVAILLMLQQRGQVTAAEVATEMEVSERTARRDLDALGMAGIPVYSTQGRGGGWRLAGGGRTDLSGLSSDEARALFLVAGPAAGATPEVKAALRKLIRALPEDLRGRAEAASGAIVVDPDGWGQRRPVSNPPLLDPVQAAVVDGVQIRLDYVDRQGEATSRVVHPLGVAAKGNTWYLVADTEAGMRTFRVDRIQDLDTTGDPVARPDGFDLAEVWSLVVDRVDRLRTPFVAQVLVRPDEMGLLRMVLGTRLGIGAATADGRIQAEARGHSVWSLAGELAGLGARVEVIGPDELRNLLAEIGRELVDAYDTPDLPSTADESASA
ncbi:MAG TPA: WYL domain-containing protein [Microthrixaceae bacterium]|nr:WYL domain-containing protein [Microthrixaceae bacterium]